MKSYRLLFLAGALLTCSAGAQAEQRPVGEILGNRGELVKPIVPGPPTYTGEPSQNRQQESDRLCELPDEGYLDPRIANSAQPLVPVQLYSGWLAKSLLGQKVYGREGNQIGEVEDISFDPDARIAAIVVEGGGFFEIGVGAFRSPWNQVRLTPGREGVTIDLSEAEVERMDLFR